MSASLFRSFDIATPLPPDGLTAVAALVIALRVFGEAPDPVTPSDDVMLVEPGDVVIEELPDSDEAVLLLGVDMLELIGDGRDDAGAIGGNISDIPVTARGFSSLSGKIHDLITDGPFSPTCSRYPRRAAEIPD